MDVGLVLLSALLMSIAAVTISYNVGCYLLMASSVSSALAAFLAVPALSVHAIFSNLRNVAL
jgi:hypothetical protein